MVDRIGFEPICCPVCQTGDHPKQSHSPNINYNGGQGGIRTHRTLILSQVSIPVPSPGHICGFCLLVPQTRSTYAFLGVHTRQQHHWTTRISGWVVVIISPVYSLAPHSGPNPIRTEVPGRQFFSSIDKLHGFLCMFVYCLTRVERSA